jgi:hypothetical protein
MNTAKNLRRAIRGRVNRLKKKYVVEQWKAGLGHDTALFHLGRAETLLHTIQSLQKLV